VRSSISRLKRRGMLDAGKRDGAAGYALSGEALSILREGDRRIFARHRANVADGWVLAVFSVPESRRYHRHVLRTELTRLGFGTAAPGVWIAPAHLYQAVAETLSRLDLTGYVDLFRAEHAAFGDVRQKVGQWWDLDRLDTLYRDFCADHGAVLRRARRRSGRPHPREAFADYVRALTEWRRLPYLDPGLPRELLPRHWAGIRAAEMFFTLRDALEEPARTYVRGVVAGRQR
jgi:phenylacetic acid degradation operon negative regulatory protein